jgi:hypothetical protein
VWSFIHLTVIAGLRRRAAVIQEARWRRFIKVVKLWSVSSRRARQKQSVRRNRVAAFGKGGHRP